MKPSISSRNATCSTSGRARWSGSWRRLAADSFRLLLLVAGLALLAPAGGLARDFLPAPEFPDDLPWLNVSQPLSLKMLRGKVVVLDFWTYGCINCLHVADELKALEQRFGNRLAVIGVHSPKFDNERDLAMLRRNILRYQLRHPVVQDEEFRLMEAYGARAWPTLAVVDPAGRYVARLVGENVAGRLQRIIEYLLEEHAGSIDDSPLPLALEELSAGGTGLAGPGKVAAADNVVAISDTLHHRVVVAGRDGRVRSVFGGSEGFADGSEREARFRAPQGLVIDGSRIYVADAGNHAVRMIDLDSGMVSTLAGTGSVASRVGFAGEGDALALDLRSPWALALDGTRLYIAMAGSHQIWRLDLTSGRLGPFAGSGREGLDDGPAMVASFSQPSGLAISGRDLFVADAEASAVRRVGLDDGRVETLVGQGLFEFGDRDGDFARALLQHPADVAVLAPDTLLVADTYNHRLRRLDLKARRVATVAGDGQPRGKGGAGVLTLDEPSGLAVSGDLVLVADTNNDRVLRYDPGSRALAEWPLVWPAPSGEAGAVRRP